MKKGGIIKGLLGVLLCLTPLLMGSPAPGSDPFPVFPCLEPNIRFWIDIYTKYPTTKGVIHDNDDLSIVYDVIDLLPPDGPGARKGNHQRIRRAMEHYKRILEELAQNRMSQDPEAERIAVMFGLNASPAVFREARGNLRCQVGQKDRFEEGLIRSAAYIEEIKEIFRSYGLPEDLAYLPHVESSFNVKASSKAGAAGMWQFTRPTGRRLLKVNNAVDERRDPIRSSEAAAKLLMSNHALLGDWPMAITAYNHGTGGLMKARKKIGDYEEIFQSYEGRRFKFASRNFYSEFLAARHVAKNYEQFFSSIQVTRSMEAREIRTEEQASVADLSQRYALDIETIAMLNPGLGKDVLKGRKQVPKGYALRLPTEWVTVSSAAPLTRHPKPWQ